MAGEAPELEQRQAARWLSECPDGKLSVYMLLASGLIGGLLYLLNWSLFT
jgi:hypothetical protein